MEAEKLCLKLQNIKTFYQFECLPQQGVVEQNIYFSPISEYMLAVN